MADTQRRPSAALAVLQRLRCHDPTLSLRTAVTFLMVCENEEVSLSELAYLLGESAWNVTRSIDRLSRAGTTARRPGRIEPQSLIERTAWEKDGRLRIVRLTEYGLRLRREIDALIQERRSLEDSAGRSS